MDEELSVLATKRVSLVKKLAGVTCITDQSGVVLKQYRLGGEMPLRAHLPARCHPGIGVELWWWYLIIIVIIYLGGLPRLPRVPDALNCPHVNQTASLTRVSFSRVDPLSPSSSLFTLC
eukprot:m.79649 g.79649  ORF g.79649 m.79649 type:complete len:119 (+) comp19311_c1_seq2:1451-1807(+)